MTVFSERIKAKKRREKEMKRKRNPTDFKQVLKNMKEVK